MQTITDAFQALKNSSHTVVYLVYLAGLNKALTTYPIDHRGVWRLGEPLVLGGGVRLGDVRGAYDRDLHLLARGGLGAIEHEFNDVDGTSRVAGVSIRILNHAGYANFLSTRSIDNTAVRILVGFAGMALSTYLPVFTGVIDRYTLSLEALTLSCIDSTFHKHRNLSLALGNEHFVGVPSSTKGKAVPIALGRNINLTCLPLVGDARGTLFEDIGTSATSCLLIEFGAPFPSSGTITLGSETGVTYSSRALVIIARQTYLRLEGLERGAAVTQDAGAAVVLTPSDYPYLIAYSIFDLSAVRIAGVLQTSGYTLEIGATGANRPVSLLHFAALPEGVVTADVRGANFVPRVQLVNGDFESGDTSGWTMLGSGTFAVTADEAEAGTYKAEILGTPDGGYTSVYQDFATLVEQRYTVQFSYRDHEEGINLLTNADFEAGVLAPFVDGSNLGAKAYVSHSGASNGNYGACIGGYVSNASGYSGHFYVDVATTIGTIYVLTFFYTSEYYYTGMYGDLPYGVGVEYLAYWAQGGYAIGTPTAPWSIAHTEFPRRPGGSEQTRTGWRHKFFPSEQISFTATATTTRLSFLGKGSITGDGPLFPVCYDDIRLTEAALVSRSISAYRLGTNDDPDAYGKELALPQHLGYVVQEVSFIAQTATTRLTLRSTYAGLPTASYFDNAQVLDAGLNPIDSMRYVIETFLPRLRINEATFAIAHAARDTWFFGTLLRAPGDSRVLLQRMAAQCACWYYEDGAGRASVVPIPTTIASPVETFGAQRIDVDSFSAQPEPLDNVYTSFYVYYGYDGSGSETDAAAYAGVLYATPTATNLDQRDLTPLCQGALGLYGRQHRLDLYADLVQDAQTAAFLLIHTVESRTARKLELSLRVYFRGIHLERGDIIRIKHPGLPDAERALLATVQRTRIDPGTAMIEMRAKAFSADGWLENFDYPTPQIITPGWVEDFDGGGLFYLLGVGWVEEFDDENAELASPMRRLDDVPRRRRRRHPGRGMGGDFQRRQFT